MRFASCTSAMKRRILEHWRRLLRERRGQVLAEYSVMMWFFTLIGVTALVTFFFAFEEGVVAYYEDVVNIICLPFP